MNPPDCFPGTVVPLSDIPLLDGLFSATNGITLSQVCEITGLEPVTIHNWVKRGYVNPPVKRKYSKGQVARIILIKILRETLVIEKATKLLSYVNGDLLDRSDDIMDDSEIYHCLCSILVDMGGKRGTDIDAINKRIEMVLKDYKEPYPGSRDRLKLALKVMVYAWESAKYKGYAIKLVEE